MKREILKPCGWTSLFYDSSRIVSSPLNSSNQHSLGVLQLTQRPSVREACFVMELGPAFPSPPSHQSIARQCSGWARPAPPRRRVRGGLRPVPSSEYKYASPQRYAAALLKSVPLGFIPSLVESIQFLSCCDQVAHNPCPPLPTPVCVCSRALSVMRDASYMMHCPLRTDSYSSSFLFREGRTYRPCPCKCP